MEKISRISAICPRREIPSGSNGFKFPVSRQKTRFLFKQSTDFPSGQNKDGS
jgi:hypothetical protein